MASRITGQVARMHGDSSPGEPLHVRHRGVVIFLRVVCFLFLENGEYAARRSVALRAGAYAGATDQDAVAINIHHLLRNAYQHHERPARRELWSPPIFTWLEWSGRLAGTCALRMEGGLFHRVGGAQENG